VEFDFDLGADTAMSVASEMVEDLSLSAEDARSIAAAIREEIKLLTGLLQRGKDSLASSSAGVRFLLLSSCLQACKAQSRLSNSLMGPTVGAGDCAPAKVPREVVWAARPAWQLGLAGIGVAAVAVIPFPGAPAPVSSCADKHETPRHTRPT